MFPEIGRQPRRHVDPDAFLGAKDGRHPEHPAPSIGEEGLGACSGRQRGKSSRRETVDELHSIGPTGHQHRPTGGVSPGQRRPQFVVAGRPRCMSGGMLRRLRGVFRLFLWIHSGLLAVGRGGEYAVSGGRLPGNFSPLRERSAETLRRRGHRNTSTHAAVECRKQGAFFPLPAQVQKDTTMATVDCRNGCRNDHDDDDDDDMLDDPLAVADVEHSDALRAAEDGGVANLRSPRRQQRQLHRIAEVRRLQGVTLRNVSRRLGAPLSAVRRQEQPDCDLRVSDLLQWQEVLEVPVAELLVEGEGQLSGPVLERSRMVKLMKTAAAIRERTQDTTTARMVSMLIEQILELMPELADVTPWHTIGQRRTLDDVGRTARQTVAEEVFRRPLRD